jgi:hypothetical protein
MGATLFMRADRHDEDNMRFSRICEMAYKEPFMWRLRASIRL